ncbi:MAG: chromosome segregation protein SMC [Acidobacteriota bacterium]
MRLERLEISGFKSFSDRSELSFDQGVTAIVGPNGCGKSNLADALTWVMGEQSVKSLRGEKMEDIIFSGSDARKATGAAEVRLRFSGVALTPTVLPSELPRGRVGEPGESATNGHSNGHSNGHGDEQLALTADLDGASMVREVEVTRRLYRSGESEYLIDGHLCRLRDIHELLMDTGLGAKAYAIIEQGKIGLILSSRPTDRRQLIEEAAGITKYKARRRAAELKLEAAQQNLTRIDDIVYEIEKQRGSLKRQAAKARRYTRLRDEMRRWEKVLLARRYRALAEAIESARMRLAEMRAQEAAAAARLSETEIEIARLRIESAHADGAAARVREEAHARELEINRRQQQIALDTQQAEMLQVRAGELDIELATLENRREPERVLLDERRATAGEAARQRDEAAVIAETTGSDYVEVQRRIEIADGAVGRARDELHAIVNTVTALTAALHSATDQRERAAAALSRLETESADLEAEHRRARQAHLHASDALALAHEALDATRIARAARDSELASARIEHEWRAREVRSREHGLASLTARLRSLEELDAHRAGFGDAARMILARANGSVGQMGALADVLEVESRYERAVEACLGDLLQHVLVPRHTHAAAGLALVREQDAGRCGFVVVEPGEEARRPTVASHETPEPGLPSEAVRLSHVLRISSDHRTAIHAAIGEALIVASFDEARALAARQPLPVATLEGDVLHGAHLVSGGGKVEARGILATKREIKELRERIAAEREALERLADETGRFEQTIAQASAAVAALAAELHRQEKAIVGAEAQQQRAADDETRLDQRRAVLGIDIGAVREEIGGVDLRQTETRDSLTRLAEDRARAEQELAAAQRTLMAAREAAEASAQRAAEARAMHAALVERCVAATVEIERLVAGAGALEQRLRTCAADLSLMREQRERLLAAVEEGYRLVDEDVHRLEAIRQHVQDADQHAAQVRALVDQQELVIRDARRSVDAVRASTAELDVTRATAESDLTHLAQQCLDAVSEPLDAVRAEVDAMEAAGAIEPDANAIRAVEAIDPDEEDDEPGGEAHGVADLAAGAEADLRPTASVPQMTAAEAIAELREKIGRLGLVNMMAIEQFTELDQRHAFLTTQRRDLVESIAQTNEAIRRIDTTTHARFRDAFSAIDANFQDTFATLFGGGRAGLALLDETDPLESGIDIVASPPGKRLQSVQLLSGGEKALTAIALMFAIFRYKPSPFCVLDEIDAPLDDANISRFVEMLRGMLDRTQFIIITHNRKTMEIANRLYGVTMEEPGVSKLISIQLN